MKKGKLILSAAAFVITAVGAFAFKTHKNHQKRLLGLTSNGNVCIASTCFTSSGTPSGSVACHTIVQGNIVLNAGPNGSLWKATKGSPNLGVCTQPTLNYTHTF